MRKWLPESIVLCAILMVVSYGFAQSWTQFGSSFGVDNEFIALSADGNIIMTVGSTNPSRCYLEPISIIATSQIL
jgi:hypothetical protein